MIGYFGHVIIDNTFYKNSTRIVVYNVYQSNNLEIIIPNKNQLHMTGSFKKKLECKRIYNAQLSPIARPNFVNLVKRLEMTLSMYLDASSESRHMLYTRYPIVSASRACLACL